MARTMNVAVLRFDRTAALIDGKARSEDVNFVNCPGGAPAIQGLLNGAFDAADVPLVHYTFWRNTGVPLTAIPVFSDRLFQHQYIYTRPDTGITDPSQMRGRRVMCAPAYYATPAFWHRALLKEHYGIEPQEIEWHTPRAEVYKEMKPPDSVTVKISSASILGVERLLDGTVDCLVTARTVYVPDEQRSRVRRVIGNAYEQQRDWATKNKVFPILHVVAIRKDSLAARPGFAVDLCRAYDEAKQRAYDVLQDERMTSLPLLRGYLDDTVATFGDDPWPYGFARNQAELDRFLGYVQEQGMTSGRLIARELFDEQAAKHEFKARMVPGCITGMSDGGWAPTTIQTPR
jgi:4,5-dihydroxyphthalate decarboxylase